MKVKLTLKKEVTVKTLHVDAGVRYWEDATVNGVEDEQGHLIPCREGERWRPIIDIDKGQITNWTAGIEASIHYKICDDGTYTLKDENGKVVIEKDMYVPETLYPEGEGYGDYIILQVDTNGMIKDWKFNPEDFEDSEDD